MSKKKTTDKAMPQAPPKPTSQKSRPPSRDKVKASYLPSDLYDWLKRYADSKSTPYDKKSVAWAFRQAVYWFKQHIEGNQVSDEDDDD